MPVPPVGPDDPAWRRFLYWLWGIAVFVLIGYVTYWFSGSFAWLFDELIGERILTRNSTEAMWVSRVLLFALLLFGVAGPLQNIVFSKSSGGGGELWRRVKGLLLDITVVSVVWVLPAWAAFEWGPDGPAYVILIWLLSLGVFLWWRWPVYGWVGRMTAPVRQWWRRRGFGAGGSAGFGGLFEEFAALFRSGSLLLGSSLYFSPRRWKGFKIGVQDDRHMLTIAGSRGGKGRSAIIPNLILWPHSALVIDPKGTNAAVTAPRRGRHREGSRVTDCLGQDVFVVDPFEIVEGVERASFNPLAVIDVDALTVTEDINNLADALVMPEEAAAAQHFVDCAKTIIAGVIAQLLTQEFKRTPSLLDVRRALTGSAEEMDALFGAMAQNERAGGLAKVAATLMENAGPNERGGFVTTITSNMKWLDSVAMQKILGRMDFDIADLKKGNMTVYVVLPPDLLEEHKRFMRLFVNLAIRQMSRGRRSEKPVLFVLDEFFALGTMTLLEKAAGLLGGYNVKLWPIIQNLTQLIELYPKNWETFFSNAGAVQVFAVNDLRTEDHLMKLLGKAVRDIEVGGRVQRVVVQLRETGEVGKDLAREGRRQIVYRSGAPPLLLRRSNYDSIFPKSQYAPDPDYPGS